MKQSANKAIGSPISRARQRPEGVSPPAHWQKSGAPTPRAVEVDPATEQPGGRDPVRYGDWEYKGLAIDF
ncbi:MAG: DUF1674 domain-containing protein [Sphingopyxis sp.]|nr:DUF1674 domain-containing protein [Sphingopyxis sp.]